MSQSQYQDIEFLVFGDSNVGKTSLLKQISVEKFEEDHYPTTGIELIIKQIQIGDEILKFRLWEFPGYSNFKQFARMYYKRAQGLILLYDITDYQSFKNIEIHLEEAIQHHDSLLSIILIGNKVDKDSKRQVSIEEAMDYANKKGIHFKEISVKTKQNLNLTLVQCIIDVLEKAKIQGIELKKSINNNNQETESQSLNLVNKLKQNLQKCY